VIYSYNKSNQMY